MATREFGCAIGDSGEGAENEAEGETGAENELDRTRVGEWSGTDGGA